MRIKPIRFIIIAATLLIILIYLLVLSNLDLSYIFKEKPPPEPQPPSNIQTEPKEPPRFLEDLENRGIAVSNATVEGGTSASYNRLT